MITKAKLHIYKSFNGDIDSWARGGSKKEKTIMTDDDWGTIDSIVQDIGLVQRGIVSKDYADALEVRIKNSCDCDETIEFLRKLT